MFFDAERGIYYFVIQEGIKKIEIATNYKDTPDTSSQGDIIIIEEEDDFTTYDEGLLADRPEANYTELKIYYATDEDKHYTIQTSNDGIVVRYWVEIDITTVDVLPKNTSGLFKVTENGYKYVYSISPKYKYVDLVSSGKSTIVTVPISGWIENTDSDGNTYFILDIAINGMYPEFEGVNATDYIRPSTYNVNDNENYLETFNKIKKIESGSNSIKLYTDEPITQAIKIIIYGV